MTRPVSSAFLTTMHGVALDGADGRAVDVGDNGDLAHAVGGVADAHLPVVDVLDHDAACMDHHGIGAGGYKQGNCCVEGGCLDWDKLGSYRNTKS